VDAVGLEAVGVDEYEYNAFNQLLSVTGNDGRSTAFTYDDNGNQVTKTETLAGGAAELTQYVYDQDNRLRGIALPSGVSNAFEYDANGLRVKKTDSGGTSSFLLDGLSIVAQYAPSGQRQAWYTQSLARIDEVLSVVNSTGKYWYQADALGSVYALTTASGGIQARGGYDVFGAPVAMGGTPVGQPFGFTGREHEGDSGLAYARQRYLSPSTGRWQNVDPAGMPDGPNRYAYARANPGRFTDPMGLFIRTGLDETPTGLRAYTIALAVLQIIDSLGSPGACTDCERWVESNSPGPEALGFTLLVLALETEYNVASWGTEQPEVRDIVINAEVPNNGYSFPGVKRMWLLDKLLDDAPMCAIRHTIVHELVHIAGSTQNEWVVFWGTVKNCDFNREECFYVATRNRR
jgi:RHS repeat-associated protein